VRQRRQHGYESSARCGTGSEHRGKSPTSCDTGGEKGGESPASCVTSGVHAAASVSRQRVCSEGIVVVSLDEVSGDGGNRRDKMALVAFYLLHR
jgi:hypothetical protein